MAFKSKEAAREYQKKWEAANPEKAAARAQRYREKNLERLNARAREKYGEDLEKSRAYVRKRVADWRYNNQERVKVYKAQWYQDNKERVAKSNYKQLCRRYDLTLEQREKILKQQQGACAICGKQEDKRRLHIDHCHKTGRVRALLCSGCNTKVGVIENSLYPAVLAYLAKHGSVLTNGTPDNTAS